MSKHAEKKGRYYLNPILEQSETPINFKETISPRVPKVTFMETIARNHGGRVNFVKVRNDENSKDIGWGTEKSQLINKQKVIALAN
jgi:hypothetical protein